MAAILSGGQGFPLGALPVGPTPNDSLQEMIQAFSATKAVWAQIPFLDFLIRGVHTK
jgi:hypothetical protein